MIVILLSKKVEQHWNSKIKKYYENKGYIYTHMGDTFLVNVDDLTDSSSIKVDIKCDYCGHIYQTTWGKYINSKIGLVSKDCCSNKECTGKKSTDVLMIKYGTKNFYDKTKNTCLKKYGVENPFASEEIKEKIKNTNIEKYGCAVPTQNKDIYKKIINTNYEKYGVPNYGAIYSKEHTKELSSSWKGGIKNSRSERSSIEYRYWRTNIFQRDKYTCQCCKAKNHKGLNKSITLVAHHIFNWKDYPDLRYSVDNGITLCEECHKNFHIMYGKKNNNQTQLNEFIKNYSDKKIC